MRRPEHWYRFVQVTLVPPLALWFSWRFEGLDLVPRRGPLLVACNHISYFDPLAHGRFLLKVRRRPRILTKTELYGNPLFRRLLEGVGHIPVTRGSGDRAPVEEALRRLSAGETVLVYPESTVTANRDFSPMEGKTGIARLALRSGVPVLPLAVWGSHPVWQRGGKRNLKFGRPIWVGAGRSLDFSSRADGADDRDVLREVTDEVMAELTALVDDLRSRYPKGWA